MATRRESREWAVQLLFQLDMNPSEKLDPVFEAFWRDKTISEGARAFTEELVRGVLGTVGELDGIISAVAEHWAMKRMGVVDRNVIRMAVYEMRHRPDIPPVVTINEAVDLAKYFSSRESGKFVNGILDQLRKEMHRPARRPAGKGHATANG